MCIFFVFFFFKQKTAYEMRISDWVQTCALPIFGEADAALRVGTEFLELALAAAAGMALRLHDIERPGKLLCGCNSLFDAHRGNAPGAGNAKFREPFFPLLFVDVHEVRRAFRLWKREICGAASQPRPAACPPP